MDLGLVLLFIYLYIGPVLIGCVFASVLYHVIRDWREHRRREASSAEHSGVAESGTRRT